MLDNSKSEAELLQEAIEDRPDWFISKFTNDDPWEKQVEIIYSIFKNPITTVRSCHGAGKSWIASRAALAYLTAFKDSMVITTAPTNRQVESILWREIRGAYKRMKIPIGGRMYDSPRLDMNQNWYAMGFTARDPDAFQGFHPKSGHILVIVDEAAGIHEDIWVAIDAILSSEGARLLMIGNPTTVAGRFHESHHQDAKAHRIHISCFDTPNFIANGIKNLKHLREVDLENVDIVAPHLISPHWAKDKITRWGVDSPMFASRVLGNFPSQEFNTVIPLDRIEAAIEPERAKEVKKGDMQVGVDVARFGDDKTVITRRLGGWVEPQEVSSKESTAATAGRVKMRKNPTPKGIFTDVDGVGGGVNDILRDDMYPNVVDIHNNAKAVSDDTGVEFANLASQLWYHTMLRFVEGSIYLEGDPNSEEIQELVSELASRRYSITRRGWTIESKEDFKKRIGRSPDKSDSLVYSMAGDIMTPSNVAPSVGKSFHERYNRHREEFEG